MLPPRKDNTALIVVLVVVMLVIVPIVASAILYIMVSGLISSGPNTSKPVITLMLSNETATAATILVAGAQPAAVPSNFKVNMEAGSTFGTAVSMPTSPGSSVNVYVSSFASPFTVRWGDPGGDGLMSSGDQLIIGYPAGLGTGIALTFFLIWSDGSTVSQIGWLS